MEIRVIAGRRCTNRVGAAEYLGRSLQTIRLVASPKRRAATGWPEPVATQDGQLWYALDDLDGFRRSYIRAREQANLARVHHAAVDGDPDELITAVQFRNMIKTSASTWSRYVHDSKPAWERGEDGYLPRPDTAERGRGGTARKWTRRRAVAWINSRRGKVPGPGRPRRSDPSLG